MLQQYSTKHSTTASLSPSLVAIEKVKVKFRIYNKKVKIFKVAVLDLR
jgi:hypothetical protein